MFIWRTNVQHFALWTFDALSFILTWRIHICKLQENGVPRKNVICLGAALLGLRAWIWSCMWEISPSWAKVSTMFKKVIAKLSLGRKTGLLLSLVMTPPPDQRSSLEEPGPALHSTYTYYVGYMVYYNGTWKRSSTSSTLCRREMSPVTKILC